MSVTSLSHRRGHDAAELRATLEAVATYASAMRQRVTRHPADADYLADEALRHIAQHARAVLRGEPAMPPAPTAAPIPAGGIRPPAVIPSRALTVRRGVELLQDPDRRVGRMPVYELLALVRGVGPDGARQLLRAAGLLEGRLVASIPFMQRVQLAGALRNHTGARL